MGQSRTSLDSWSTRKVCYQLAMIHYWCALIGILLHLPGLVRSLKNEVGQLTGEKASLQREVEKLRAEVSPSSLSPPFSLSSLSLSSLPDFYSKFCKCHVSACFLTEWRVAKAVGGTPERVGSKGKEFGAG